MTKPFIFFNHSGIGDVILTKPFCKKIKELLNLKEIYYAHAHDNKITSDLSNYISIHNLPVTTDNLLVQTKDATYFNTFFFKNNDIIPLSKRDTTRCYYEFLLDGFNLQLKQLNLNLPDNVDDLMWNPTYSHTEQIKKIFPTLIENNRQRVLIYNQTTFAGQSDNIGMQTLIQVIARRHPHVQFFISQDYKSDTPNTINVARELIKAGNNTTNNLQELTTISKFCDIIVGPANGPLFASWIRPNICNERKTYITTITSELSHGRTQYYSGQRTQNIITHSTIEMFNQLDNVLSIKSA
jgi:hypothetical protein